MLASLRILSSCQRSCRLKKNLKQGGGSESGFLWIHLRHIRSSSPTGERSEVVECHPCRLWWRISFSRQRFSHWFLWMWKYCWRDWPNLSVEKTVSTVTETKNQKPQPCIVSWSCFIHACWFVCSYIISRATKCQSPPNTTSNFSANVQDTLLPL